MPKRFEPFDAADYLKRPQDIAEYLNAALEEEDECPGLFLRALGDAVRARKGMSNVSSETGLSRDTLYKALSEDGNPKISSLFAVLHSVGLDLAVRPRT